MRLSKSSLIINSLAVLLAINVSLSPAHAQSPINPPSGWMPFGQPILLQASVKGAPDLPSASLAVPRQNDVLTSELQLWVFKNAVPTTDGYDYYLVAGTFEHGVSGYAINGVSCGYQATQMNLSISGNGAHALTEYNPSTTVGQTSTSFTIGGSIGASSEGPNGSVSFGYTVSYTTPDVVFSTRGTGTTLNVQASLPYVGSTDGIQPITPKPASSAGYDYQPAMIFQVVHNGPLTLNISSSVNFRYDYVRGLVNDTKTAAASGTYAVNFQNTRLIGLANKCMDVYQAVAKPGQPVELWDCNGGTNQQWTLTPAGQIQSNISPTQSLCLDSTTDNNGTQVVINSCNAYSSSQKFLVGGTSSPTLQLFPQSGKCLDVDGNNPTSGTGVITWTCNGQPNQIWTPTP